MDRARLFDHDYETILADTGEARRIHHQIRYRVFCEETGYEDRDAFPGEEEYDQWDRHAVPFIVRTRRTREWVATLRLILPRGACLPSEQLCMLDRGAIAKIKPFEVAEVSRLCVLPSFRSRRRPVDLNRTINQRQQQESEITLGLLRAAAAYSRTRQIRYWYVLTTGGFARLMSRLYLPLHPIGTGIEHRGKRYPFLAHIEKSRTRAERLSADFARLFSHPEPYVRYSALSGDRPEPAWGETGELDLVCTA